MDYFLGTRYESLALVVWWCKVNLAGKRQLVGCVAKIELR